MWSAVALSHWGFKFRTIVRIAFASHLVSAGLSLKEVGDHLGHRSAYATRIYAKVDLAGLREVADFDLRGLT